MGFSHLTLAYGCVVAAAVLPYVAAWIAKAGAFRPRDNLEPRAWAARQSGWRARANAAQANSFEGLPFFIGGVVIAHQLGAPQARIDLLASAYVLLRAAYIALYLGDKAAARSTVWALGMAVNVALFFIAK